jgi:hypothetical protein
MYIYKASLYFDMMRCTDVYAVIFRSLSTLGIGKGRDDLDTSDITVITIIDIISKSFGSIYF